MSKNLEVSYPNSIKGYVFTHELGRGAFSVVCKAKSISTNNIFACKIFPKSNLADEGDHERFQREINAMAFLRNENIVTLHDFFWDENNFYLIMDLCPGGELFDYIVDHDKLDEPTSAVIFKQIVSAIHYCHSLGVAHRDLKPENVLIDKFPRIKVSDFGLCGYIQGQRLMKTFCGSPCYCSPECLCRVQYDGRISDVWSLGVILYAMVTGEHPWNISNTSVMLRQILRGAYIVPSYVSYDCKDLICRMMQVNPKDRITVEEIISHPWLKLADKANIPMPPPSLIKPPALPSTQGLSLEEISQASAQSSERSENGIINPFENIEDDTPELPKLCIALRSQSVQNLLAKKNKSGLPLLSASGGDPSRRVLKPSKANISLQRRQKSTINLLLPKVSKPVIKYPMSTINED